MPKLTVIYQISEDGDCEECQAEHRQYCMAFKEYHKEQLQSCKDFLANEASKSKEQV
jgi:Zn-dependent alcohol dehydrogenase